MKLFVSNQADTLDWDRDASLTHRRRLPGGRFRRLADLEWAVLPLIGLVFLAEIASLIELGRTMQFLLTGLGTGLAIGKSVVVWRERGGQELEPRLVRRIEHSWALVGVSASALLALLA